MRPIKKMFVDLETTGLLPARKEIPMRPIKKMFVDLETTGLLPNQHSIFQLAGIIEIDDEPVHNFNILMRPHIKARVDPKALKRCNISEELIKSYQSQEDGLKQFNLMLSKYVDRFNPKDKLHIVGYYNRSFDDIFLRKWFDIHGDTFFGSWFYPDSIDVLVLASEYLLDRRPHMPSFQLGRVAKTIGLTVEDTNLHDAYYDVILTRKVYRIVTGKDFEL